MSIDSMRVGGGRCPPLLVGGLIIACIMMVCNWWTLSSTNLELLRQIDELNEQIKISVEERDQCVTQRGTFEKQLKNCQDDARTTHVKLSQVEDTYSTCNEELNSYKRTEISKTATLEALRIDKQGLNAQIEIFKKEKKEMEEELSKVKEELEKTKLSLNAPPPKQAPLLPIARVLEKPNNKTAMNSPQVNAPPNAEAQEQEFQEKDLSNNKEDNAAEVHDAANAIDPDLNFNFDTKPQETNQ